MNLASQFKASNRARLFWRLQGLGWGGTLLLAIGMGGFVFWPTKDAIVLGALRSLFGFVATSFFLRPILRFGRRRRPALSWSNLIGLFLLCGILGLADTAFIAGMGQLIQANLEQAGLRQFLSVSVLVRWVLYGGWCLLYFFIPYWLDTQQNQLRIAQTEAALRASELHLLRAQVNPHFLFNALNSILAESANPTSVQRITLALADYLRFSLKQHRNTELLGVELEALESYLLVEKARFEENLKYGIKTDSRSARTRAPVALVQPLLENAIKFGQRSPLRPLRVEITSVLEDDTLIVTVTNSGEWCEPEEGSSTGTGLPNLRRRLYLLYGDKAVLTLEAKNQTVWARVELPVIAEERP